MLVVGKENNFLNNSFNAQRAAINGFSLFAKKIIYLLDENNNINNEKFNTSLKNNNNKFIIFGLPLICILN